MIKRVAFDLDGTLVDSERLYLTANAWAAAQLGKTIAPEAFLPLVGAAEPDVLAFLSAHFAPADQQRFVRMSQEYVTHRVDTVGPPELVGADELLHQLQEAGLGLSIVSSNHRDYVQRVLAKLNWQAYFDVVITFEDISQPKPASEAYQRLLTKTGLNPDEVVAVEDSPIGVAAAVAAGLPTIQLADLLPPSQLATVQLDYLAAIWPWLQPRL